LTTRFRSIKTFHLRLI